LRTIVSTDLTLTTVDGVTLAGRITPGQGSEPVTVVVAHGFAASKDDAAVCAVGGALNAGGYSVLTYDSRGQGESEGLCTLGDAERHDVAAAVAWARTQSDRVVLVGASMGAIAVLRHAATDPDLAGVVTVSSPAAWRVPRNLRSLLAAGLTQTPPGRFLAARYMRVRLARGWARPDPPHRLVRGVTAPIAIVHGTDDRFIEPAEARTLHAHAHDPRRLELVPGMGHAFDAPAVPVVRGAVDWALARRAVSP
jgi:pimeloyl-ACP methyl ester carboxylesterase